MLFPAKCDLPLSAAPEDFELAKTLPTDLFTLLLRSAHYAQNTCHPPWDFAVDLGHLRALGVNDCDLRWLLCKGFVEHAVESSRAGCVARSFRPGPALLFEERSSFILTSTGVRLAQRLFTQNAGAIAQHHAKCNRSIHA